MGLGVLTHTLAALAFTQTAQATPDPPAGQAGEVHEIRIGHELQPLPFRLNLNRRARPPRSLTEMVDRLYAAIPTDRLDMFAAYYGAEAEFERARARYDSTVSFFYGLYTIEILYEAYGVWFGERRFPLLRARRCAGEYYVDEVAMQLGARRIQARWLEGVQSPHSERESAYRLAARISAQLFAMCDGRQLPRRVRAR